MSFFVKIECLLSPTYHVHVAYALFFVEMSSTTLHVYAYEKSHEQVVRRRSNIGFKIGGLNLVHCVGRSSTPTQVNVMIFLEKKDIALKIMVSKIQTSS